MHPLSKLLLAVALLLGVVGVGVALVQPGDLGDSGTEAAAPATTTSTTARDDAATTTTSTSTGDADEPTTSPPTTSPPTTSAPTTSSPNPTTAPPGGSLDSGPAASGGTGVDAGTGGSGLDGGSNAPTDLEDGLADTGGPPLIGAALAVAAVGLALPRRRDRTARR